MGLSSSWRESRRDEVGMSRGVELDFLENENFQCVYDILGVFLKTGLVLK